MSILYESHANITLTLFELHTNTVFVFSVVRAAAGLEISRGLLHGSAPPAPIGSKGGEGTNNIC